MSGKILFFGKLADVAGYSEAPLPAFDGRLAAADLIALITAGNSDLAEALADPVNRLCLNQAMVPPGVDVEIASTDEVAFLPPMSGG